jgi:hypothetical protein
MVSTETVNLIFDPNCVLGRMVRYRRPIDTRQPTTLIDVGVHPGATRPAPTSSSSPCILCGSIPTPPTPPIAPLLRPDLLDDHTQSRIDIERPTHPTHPKGDYSPQYDIHSSISARIESPRSDSHTEILVKEHVHDGSLWDIYSGTLTTHSHAREAKTIEVIVKISSLTLFQELYSDLRDSERYDLNEAHAAIRNEDRIYQGALHDLQGGAIPAYHGLYSSYTGPQDKPRGVHVMVLEKLEAALSEEELLSDLRDDLK